MENARHIETPGKKKFAAFECTKTTAQTTAAGKGFDRQVLKDADVEILKQSCRKYYEAGARFAEIRAVLKIDGETESLKPAIQQKAQDLACCAFICQENRLVPIVDPEVLTDGSHDIDKCAAVTETLLAAVYKALNDHHVLLEGTLLKTNMVTPGSYSPNKTADKIAVYTVTVLRRTVPAAVPGIVFLSGGQREEKATQTEINNLKVSKPWTLLFLARSKDESDATLGEYTGGGSSSAGGLATPTYIPLYQLY